MLKDLECTQCGHIEERYYLSTQPVCNICGSETRALISANFAFNFTDGRGTDMGLTTSYPSSRKNNIKRG